MILEVYQIPSDIALNFLVFFPQHIIISNLVLFTCNPYTDLNNKTQLHTYRLVNSGEFLGIGFL